MQSDTNWSPLSYDESFLSWWGRALIQDDTSAQEFTERFGEDENEVECGFWLFFLPKPLGGIPNKYS